MRAKIMIALTVVVLAVLNYGIYAKERIRAHGDDLFLELAPVDPRSLMQGDYMRLRYAIERAARYQVSASKQNRGYIVIRLEKGRVAKFIRLHAEETLARGEKLLRFRTRKGQVQIVPDSFLFQEGHREYYQEARYGVFKLDTAGNHLLVGLADADRQRITPTPP